jgi:hypothetical protein
MERGFALPQSAVTRLVIQWAIGFVIGIGLVYLKYPHETVATLLWLLAVEAALLVAMAWYVKQYKYVHLSAAGIRGRPTNGFKLRDIPWVEPLTFKKASLKGLTGQLFTSGTTAKSIFIPQAILQSPEFNVYVNQYAPPTHVLRITKF